MKTTKKKTENIEQEIEELKAKYLRALADYQNLEKRVSIQMDEVKKFASKSILLKVLPIIDDLEKANNVLKDEGISHILNHFQEILEKENVIKIEVMGKKFDPVYMECISVEESEKDDEVIEEIRKGYVFCDKVLRTAQVKVGRKFKKS